MRRSLLNKIRSYSALAGVVALAVPASDAEGQIIYTNVQPDDTLSSSGEFLLDLNSDGITDYTVYSTGGSSSYSTMMGMWAPYGNLIMVSSSNWDIEKLKVHDSIPGKFNKYSSAEFSWGGEGYVGLEFITNGNTYYGWLRVEPISSYKIIIKDYAYNTTPGQPLVAGQNVCNPFVKAPTVTLLGDTLSTIKPDSLLQWKKDGIFIPAFTDSLRLVTPPHGVYATVHTDTAGCHLQSEPVNYVKCDSIPTKILSENKPFSCGNQSALVSLHYTSTQLGLKFQWLKNNLPIAGATNADYYSFQNFTAYFNLVVSYKGCADTSAPFNFSVYPVPPPPVISDVHDTLFSSPATDYRWYINGQTTVLDSLPFFVPTTSNTYKLVITDANGCSAASTFLYDTCSYINPTIINVNPGTDSVCMGKSFTLKAVPSSGFFYQWYSSSTLLPGADSVFFTYKKTGDYKVLITDSAGCKRFSSPIKIFSRNAPPAAIYLLNDTLFSNTGPATYQWLQDTVPIAGATNRYYKAPAYGQYSVLVTNIYGCDSLSLPFAYIACSQAQGAVISSDHSNTDFCAGDSLKLSVIAIPGYTCSWLRDSIMLPGQASFSLNAKTSGMYQAVLTDTAHHCSITTTAIKATAFPLPPKPVITYYGGELHVTGKGTGTLQWYKDGLIMHLGSVDHYAFDSSYAAIYYVTVTDAHGCSSVSDFFSFTPNGIERLQADKPYYLLSSPGRLILHFNTPSVMGGNITLQNVLGQKIVNSEIDKEEETIAVKGNTFLLITIEKGNKRWQEKIITQ